MCVYKYTCVYIRALNSDTFAIRLTDLDPFSTSHALIIKSHSLSYVYLYYLSYIIPIFSSDCPYLYILFLKKFLFSMEISPPQFECLICYILSYI